jgi:AbrB family looped-hinge helix DNA binding protein
MADVTITSKRQATLPAELCEELGVKPGDRLRVERRVVDGEPLWVVTGKKPDWSFFGAARRYGKGKSHRLADIEVSIGKAWAADGDRT